MTASFMHLASFGSFEEEIFSSTTRMAFSPTLSPVSEWMSPCHTQLSETNGLYRLSRSMDYITRIWLHIDPTKLQTVELVLDTEDGEYDDVLQTVTPESLEIAQIRTNEPRTLEIVSIPLFFTTAQPFAIVATPYSALYIRVTATASYTVHQDGLTVNGEFRSRLIRSPHALLSERSETEIMPYAPQVLLPFCFGALKAFFFMVRVGGRYVSLTKPISLYCGKHPIIEEVPPDYFSVMQPHDQGMPPLPTGYYMYSFATDHRSLAHTGAPNCSNLEFRLRFGDAFEEDAEIVTVGLFHTLIRMENGGFEQHDGNEV
jgi:hypothetical protein